MGTFAFSITQTFSRATLFKNNLVELTAIHMTSLLRSDKITSNYSKIPGGPKKTNPKLIEWCLKVGIYKSKSLLNIVYVIYFEVFCKVLSQNIKYWTSYDIFSSGIDIDNACKKKK